MKKRKRRREVQVYHGYTTENVDIIRPLHILDVHIRNPCNRRYHTRAIHHRIHALHEVPTLFKNTIPVLLARDISLYAVQT